MDGEGSFVLDSGGKYWCPACEERFGFGYRLLEHLMREHECPGDLALRIANVAVDRAYPDFEVHEKSLEAVA